MEVNSSLKLALAITALRSRNLGPSSENDVQHWKKKAKDRKRELMKLKEELKDIQDGMTDDMFPQSVSCKCYFFENCGKLSPRSRVQWHDESDNRINEVLHRSFLRLVRSKRRKKRYDTVKERHLKELNVEDEIEQLVISTDFLVEVANAQSSTRVMFEAMRIGQKMQGSTLRGVHWWISRQNEVGAKGLQREVIHEVPDQLGAITISQSSLKKFLSRKKNSELVEGIINRLIMHLNRRMCIPAQQDGSEHSDSDAQFQVQHLMRKLGSEPYIGQRTMLSVCQRIAALAESLLVMDPFDDAFPNAHGCMFMMIQLIEFLVSDYTHTWTNDEGFENNLFEEWVRSILQAKNALELLESRNGLYILYMDRVIGGLAKQVSQILCSGKQMTLDASTLEALFD